jgi:two-component sensor histidine kinase
MSERPRKYLLLPEQLFTPSVFLVSLGWMLMLHLMSYWNNAGIAPWYERVLVHIVIHFVPFAIAGLVYLALRRQTSDQRLLLFLVPAVIAGCAARGFAQVYGLNLISARVIDDPDFRIAASTTNTGFAILIAWAGFSAAESHRRRRQRLAEDQQRLLLLRQQARQDLDRMDASTAEEIRLSLLATLESQARETSEQIVAAMRRLIDEVVRPLSHHFEQRSADWRMPEPEQQSVGVDWRVVLTKAFRAENIHPAPLLAMLVWTSLPNNFFTRGPWIAVASIAHGVFFYPLFMWAKAAAIRASRNRSQGQRALIFFATLYVGGQVMGLTSWVYTRFQEPQFMYALIGPVWALVGGSLIAFAKAAKAESEAMESTLLNTDAELRWSLARAREAHRQQRRALAHALHGQVQTAVASAILRLEMSNREGDASPDVAEVIVESLKSKITEVDLLSASHEPVEVVLQRIRDTWAGVATITTNVQPDMSERLAHDSIAAIAVNDLLTELTFNSINHGSASEIAIEIDGMTDEILLVVVSDNGSQRRTQARRGLGSALLDTCSIWWERTHQDNRTVTTVALPISRDDALAETH